ncbi:unnamed protein product [Sphagnum jensenii]|uniref:Rab-GAP TBC domain-containing protein n=1 Tax=Sphagnum jensenii TaxID=128206 RepID=A0ABP0WG96_9BRYO
MGASSTAAQGGGAAAAAAMSSDDDPYRVRPDCLVDTAPARFHPKAGKTLSPRAWRAAFDAEGHLIRMDKVLKRVRRGGIDPSIRGEVWEFLLGCFAPNSSAEEREALRSARRADYAKLKAECRAMDDAVGSGQVVTAARIHEEEEYDNSNNEHRLLEEEQQQETSSGRKEEEDNNGNGICQANENKKTQWRLNLHQIGLDVVRTDRMLQFYERQENLGKLWDILAVYCWLDPDIGYCQGMSDFCSPVALIFADEADAFWCFERIMHRVRESFKCTDQSVGVQKQLETLAILMKVLDPKLHEHLDSIGGGNYIFAFRMVMVHFRREFSFQDTLYLWEMMWALEYVPLHISSKQDVHNNNNMMRSWIFRRKYKGRGKFDAQNLKYGAVNVPGGTAPLALYCAAAIFEMQRKPLLKQTQGLDEVLKLLNDVTGKVDAKEACKSALKLHKKYLIKVRKQVQSQQ